MSSSGERNANFNIISENNSCHILNVQISGACRLAPNMSKILYHWGLEDEVRSMAIKSESLSLLLCMSSPLPIDQFLRYSQDESGEILGHHHWDEEVLKETQGEFLFAHVSIGSNVLWPLGLTPPLLSIRTSGNYCTMQQFLVVLEFA